VLCVACNMFCVFYGVCGVILCGECVLCVVRFVCVCVCVRLRVCMFRVRILCVFVSGMVWYRCLVVCVALCVM